MTSIDSNDIGNRRKILIATIEKIKYNLDGYGALTSTQIAEKLENIIPYTFAIVRWHENTMEDVVCVNKKVALEYIEIYNKLAGEEECYLDEDVWRPLTKA